MSKRIFKGQKYLKRTLFLTGFVGFMIAGTLLAQPQRHALLIGIGNYPADGGWRKINAHNDLAVMFETLKAQGFSPENILLLKDSAATQKGILTLWQTQFLPRIRKGDVVYFQFSGHGQQVADNNGDELDAYDEAIVPYDSPLRYKAGVYQGENLIRDDDLNRLFTDLRKKLGPEGHLMVVLDACHSGTGTRGMSPARGTDQPMADEAHIQSVAKRRGDGFASPQFVAPEGVGDIAPLAAFFGAAHNQLNYETLNEQGQYIGSLTYALSKKMAQAGPNTSYRGLFEAVKTEMYAIAPRQQPQAEGNLDQELMGGRLLPRTHHYNVLRWEDSETLVMNAGWLQGIHEGAVLGLYPPETRELASTTPLAKATVRGSSPAEAVLVLDKMLGEEEAKSAWIFMLEENLGQLRVGLGLKLPENHATCQALKGKIAQYPVFRTDLAPEVFIQLKQNNIEAIGPNDQLLESFPSALPADKAAERLLNSIKAYTQAKYLRSMEATSSVLQVECELIPFELDPVSKVVKNRITLAQKCDALGTLHFQNNDAFKIKIINKGKKGAYFTLLDIQPDHVINPLIPGENEEASTFYVAPGKFMEVPYGQTQQYYEVGPPAGVETIKLIVTDKPVDLRPIIASKGSSTRSTSSALERLFGQTFFNDEIKSRNGNTTNLSAGSVRIQTVNFVIDPG
jgi:metacaspase-1